MRIINFFVLLVTAVVLLTSCGSNVNLANKYIYQTQIDSLTISALDPVIQKNDLLYINFSVAGSKAAQEIMEIYNGNNRLTNSSGNLSSSGYLVSPNGTVTVTSVGEIEVAGKTKTQVVEILQKKLKQYIGIVPVVTLRIINFSVLIQGEVTTPGRIDVQNELITLQEAIAIAGGPTTFAVLSDVELLRRENGVTRIVHLDLRGEEIYTTKKEFYYLKQNDHITIKADKEKYLAANTSNSRIIAYASTALSILLGLLTFVLR